ncbi:MAG TPA: NAD(P)-dependent alcohol dehydrogenase [Solirubrobacterales bacterium]|nr:NAD(P)-dependent alcohol dehydrogenase [Solirubrobacterales bacterium]
MPITETLARPATTARGWAAASPTVPLAPYSFERRPLGPFDVRIEILHCGVCHSDLHTVRNEWSQTFGQTLYPCVPGHEIVGRVAEIGSAVEDFAVGDRAGVGCLVDSCRECDACAEELEQYCEGEAGPIGTYSSVEPQTGRPTAGGYSSQIVVDEHFALRISERVDLAATAPLLCAGITVFSPLRHHGVGPGSRVGVVGLGGLGHMAVKLASAMGAEVTLFTTSPGKTADASALGADSVVVVSREAPAAGGDLDLVIDTVSASHDLDPYLGALKRDGALVLVGIPAVPHPSPGVAPLLGRRSLTGSSIGGLAETQEMLDFCAEHGVVAEIEPIAIDQINEAYERMLAGDVRFRFVIDMSTLRTP